MKPESADVQAPASGNGQGKPCHYAAGLLCALLFFPLAFQLRLPPRQRRQPPAKAQPQAKPTGSYPGEAGDLELARRFAPVFYQRLAGRDSPPRFDYITNFDFDGDWIGNNNWEHAADPAFPMRAYVYYAVIETASHYFITYAAFHPRDWSPAQPVISTVLDRVQENEKYGKYLPPELRRQVELNHENDLEGAQVIVRKAGPAGPEQLEAVETLAHDEFHRSFPPSSTLAPANTAEKPLELEQGHPALYVEALKHGIHQYPYDPRRSLTSALDVPDGPLLVYRFQGVAEEPQQARDSVGYDLLPLYSTFWLKASGLKEPNLTFGEVHDFGDLFCRQLPEALLPRVSNNLCRLGTTAIALRGDFAGKNKAMLPWGWRSRSEALLGPGEWFLNPARLMKAHYPEAPFDDTYLSHPFLGIFRQ